MKNKYQEALSKLEDIICELSCELKEDCELYTRDTGYEEHIEILQKLVDKETPMKVNKKEFLEFDCDDDFEYFPHMTFYYKCPNRKCKLHHKYELSFDTERCPICNQLLDWGDDRG